MNTWNIGDRVSLHPCTNEWMQGDKFGEVVGFGHKQDYTDRTSARAVRVKLDKSGRVRRFHPDNVCPIYYK